MLILTVYRRDQKLLFKLSQQDSVATKLEATPTMDPDVDRWVQDGLVELAGEEGNRRLRHTPSSDAEFMYRLKAYVERHGLIAVLKEE